MTECGNQQVQPAVAVDVGEHGSATNVIGGVNPCFEGHVLEAPASEVPVEGIASLQTAQQDVGTPVAVEIADRHAAAVLQDAVSRAGPIIENVCEMESRALRRQLGETSSPFLGDIQFRPLAMCIGVPVKVIRSTSSATEGEGRHKSKD